MTPTPTFIEKLYNFGGKFINWQIFKFKKKIQIFFISSIIEVYVVLVHYYI